MKEFKYQVAFCDGYFCDGYIKVEANNEDDAYNKATDYVLGKLANAFPELGIDVYIEET